MKGKNVVVTGGAGFIGCNLARTLSKENSVTVLDNFSTGHRENLGDMDIEFIEMDINETEKLKELFSGVDYVFHQAAIPSVPRSIQDPISSNKANIDGTLSVFEAARSTNVKKVVYASSSSVYGESPTLPKQEDMPTTPLSPYAVTKECNERYGKVFHDIYGLRTTGLRYFNVYGPYQDPKSEYAAVIPLFISWIKAGEPVRIYGDGEQTRDFTFVMDAVQANIKAAESMDCDGRALNVACGQRISINELADKIGTLLGKEVSRDHVPDRPGDIKHSLADISLARETAGYQPVYNIDKGLEETVEWFSQRLYACVGLGKPRG